MHDGESTDTTSSRRTFLAGAGAAAVAGLAAACAEETTPTTTPDNEATTATSAAPATVAAVSFGEAHQQGVVSPVTSAGLVAAFDVTVEERHGDHARRWRLAV